MHLQVKIVHIGKNIYLVERKGLESTCLFFLVANVRKFPLSAMAGRLAFSAGSSLKLALQ